MLMHIWFTTPIHRGFELYQCLLVVYDIVDRKTVHRVIIPRKQPMEFVIYSVKKTVQQWQMAFLYSAYQHCVTYKYLVTWEYDANKGCCSSYSSRCFSSIVIGVISFM